MAYTTVPAVVAGTKIPATWGNSVSTAVTELQTGFPQAMSTWSAPITGGITVGNGTTTAQYYTAGPITYCFFRFVLGTTSAVTGSVVLDLPVDATFTYGPVGTGTAYDVSATTGYPMGVEATTSTALILRVWNSAATIATNSTISSTNPFTWATGDVLAMSMWYPTT